MATRLFDDFTGTLARLVDRASVDDGHTWSSPGPAPYATVNGSGSMAGNGNTGNNENAWHISNAEAILPISTVTAPFTASAGTWNMGVIAFGSADGQNGYMGFIANGACAIQKKVAGVQSTLPGAVGVTTNGSHTLQLVVSAGSQILYVDGLPKITATDTSLDGSLGKRFGIYRDGSSTTPLMASVTGSDSAPALVAGTGSVVSSTGSTVTVTTTAPTGGATPYSYQLYRSTASGTKGSAVSGATSYPYTDTGLSSGTTYWYTWDYTGADSAVVTGTQFSATTATGISASRPTANEAIQRTRSTKKANIPITVTNNDTSSHSIEASFNGGAYATIATNLAAGATSTTSLPNQSQGSGTLTVRFVDTPATLTTVSNVMIGEIVGIGGQSNAGGAGTINQAFQSGINSAGVSRTLRKLNMAYVWQTITGDPINGDTGTGGSIWPLVATTLAANLDCDIAFVEYALGGVGLAYNSNSGQTQTWVPLPSNRQDLTTPYGNLVYKLLRGNLTSESIVVWWVGESDCAGNRTQAQQTADIQTVAAGILADVGCKSMFIRLQDCQAITNENNQRNAVLASEAALPTALVPGPTLEKYRTDDGTYHITTTAGLSAAATVVGASLLQFYGITGLPTEDKVLSGTAYGIAGTQKVGTLSVSAPNYPVLSDVRSGIVYGLGTGTLSLPTISQVLTGVQYGGGGNQFTGTHTEATPNYPALNTVKAGVVYGLGTGTLTLPSTPNVLSGVQYGGNGTEFTGTHTESTPNYPALTNVRAGVVYGLGTGTMVMPGASSVRFGVTFDNGSTGTLTLPVNSSVLNGVQYGGGGTEFTGTHTEATPNYPSLNNVRSGVVYGLGTGTLTLPLASHVRYGVSFDSSSGTLVVPGVNDVRLAVVFDNGSVGNLVVGGDIADSIEDIVDGVVTALSPIIGNPQQAGQPVTLPTIPPAGYVGSLTPDQVSKLESLGSVPITIVSPVAKGGAITVKKTITYKVVYGNEIAFELTGVVMLDDAVVTLELGNTVLTEAYSVEYVSGKWRIVFELDDNVTSMLSVGISTYSVVATYPGSPTADTLELVTGTFSVVAR